MSQSTIEDIERYSQVMRLDSDPSAGDSIIKLRAVPEGLVGATITIDPVGAHPEAVVVTAVDNRKVTFTPALSYDHTIGVPVQRMDITGGYPSGALNVKNFGAVGDGVTDDTAAIQAALATGAKYIYFPSGTYKCSGSLTPNTNANLVGDGIDITILDFSGWNDVCFYPCKKFDGLTILGDDTAGSIGIQGDDTHPVSKCSWGTIRLRHLDYGCKLIPQTYNGFYYNQFGTWYVEECVTAGLYIYPNNGTDGWVNDNFWTLFRGDNNGTAIYARYVTGLTFAHLSLENNTTGLDLDNGNMLNAFSGWMEGNTTAYTIGNNWSYFRYLGLMDAIEVRSEPPGDSSATSVSIRSGTSAYQKWWGDHYFNRITFFNLDSGDAAFPYEGIWYPKIRGSCYPYSIWSSGATKDIKASNIWYLAHGVSTEITGLTGNAGQQVTLFDHNGSGNAFINNGGNFILTANWTPNGWRDNITLWSPDGTEWREIARSMV